MSDSCWLATERASGHKNFTPIPLYSTWNAKEMGGVQPIVPCGQPRLPMTNRMVGNPGKLWDGVSVIMKVIDLMRCRKAGGGRKNTSNVPDCRRFATCNIRTMSGRSAEVVKTLHRRKIDACCVQGTRWTGSGVKSM